MAQLVSEADAGRPALRQAAAAALYMLCIAGFMAYMMVPLLYQGRFCPSDSFHSGPMSSTLVFIGGGTLGLVCANLLLFGFTPDKYGHPSLKSRVLARFAEFHPSAFVASMAAGLFVSGCLWISFFTSYYCVAPSSVIVHPWALAPLQSLPWSDVDAVVSHCGRTKHGSFGAVTLWLADGQTIDVPLGLGSYNALRRALSGSRYRYAINASVTPGGCPSDMYRLFMRW